MNKKEITIEDITYENGYPANLDFECPVVICIFQARRQPVVLYTCCLTGNQTGTYLPWNHNDKHNPGIYAINKERIFDINGIA